MRAFTDDSQRVEPVMRLYGDDFLIEVTIWVGPAVDGRAFRLADKNGKARQLA